jgi:UDP-2,3-diacylglucosamine pyrophosphatase LpxH
VLIPGNHDAALREYAGASFGDIRIEREWIHTGADGRRYLLVHGDAFDPVSQCSRFIAALGDIAYTALLRCNRHLAWWRHRLGATGYWSLSNYIKQRIRRAADYINDYEAAVVRAARKRGVDGVICGHIHVAAIKQLDGIVYINTGDWVDSCTAVVEHFDGRMELVKDVSSASRLTTRIGIEAVSSAND